MRRNHWHWIAAAAVLAACGGEEAPPAGMPAAQPAAAGEGPAATAGGTAPAGQQASTAEADEGTQLLRETFAYRGAGRDPFVSLLKSGDVRPLVDDLRVTTINYNIQYPGNSVAVLRDQSQAKRYTVRVGDRVGRLRIVQIREKEVVVTYDEFGVERQAVLRLLVRRQED